MSEETAQVPATAPSITLTDIAFLVQIVEIVAQRGAFRADELDRKSTRLNSSHT